MKTSLLTLAFLTCFILAACEPTLYSEGSRIGTVTKLSYKGIYPNQKTWEGWLQMDAMGNGWAFSVDPRDAQVIDQIKAAYRSGHRVELRYEQWQNDYSRTYETQYRVKEVTDLDGAR